jgi:hypothetical protein
MNHSGAPAKGYATSYIDLKATVNPEIKWVAGRMEGWKNGGMEEWNGEKKNLENYYFFFYVPIPSFQSSILPVVLSVK